MKKRILLCSVIVVFVVVLSTIAYANSTGATMEDSESPEYTLSYVSEYNISNEEAIQRIIEQRGSEEWWIAIQAEKDAVLLSEPTEEQIARGSKNPPAAEDLEWIDKMHKVAEEAERKSQEILLETKAILEENYKREINLAPEMDIEKGFFMPDRETMWLAVNAVKTMKLTQYEIGVLQYYLDERVLALQSSDPLYVEIIKLRSK